MHTPTAPPLRSLEQRSRFSLMIHEAMRSNMDDPEAVPGSEFRGFRGSRRSFATAELPEEKVEAIRAQGAELREMGREDLVRAHVEATWKGWPQTFVHPFAPPHVIAGQGTIGWGIPEDLPAGRTVLVPVGGGGLSSGIAIAVKSRLPGTKVFGVQAEGAAPLRTVFETRQPFRVAEPKTIADGIRIGIILPAMADLLLTNLDGCLVVSDGEIRESMRRLALEAKVVAEPAGAAAFAAWSRYREQLDAPVAVVVSGGNVDPALLADVLRGGEGR